MKILDILILGSGPAALCLASELAKQDLNIKGLSTKSPHEKWEIIQQNIITIMVY